MKIILTNDDGVGAPGLEALRGVVSEGAVVIALRKLAKVNKVILSIVVLVVVSIVGFNWIDERNEPKWATPAVNWLANYFPTKEAIQSGPQ